MRRIAYKLLIILSIFFSSICLSIKIHHDEAGIIVQSNLSVPNWIYGTFSESDLKKSIFDLMTQNTNLLKCNTNFPFYNGQKCMNCQGETPYFNLSTKKCEACTTQVFNNRCQ